MSIRSKWRWFKDLIKACLGMCAEPGCHRWTMSRFCGDDGCTYKGALAELERPSTCSRCGQPVKMVGWRINDGLETELVHCDTNEEICFAHPGSRGQVVRSLIHGRPMALLSDDVRLDGPLGFIVFEPRSTEIDFSCHWTEGEALDKAEELAQDEWEENPDPDAPRPPNPKIYALWATEWPEQKHPVPQ